MGSMLPLTLNPGHLKTMLLVAAVALLSSACSSPSALMTEASAVAQDAASPTPTSPSPSSSAFPQDTVSINTCQNAVQQRIVGDVGNQVQVSFTSGESYPISDVEAGVRGTVSSSLPNNTQPVNYRYDCAVSIREGRVTRLTYNRIDANNGSPNLTAQQAYDRGYQNGQTDAKNNRPSDAVGGTYDLGIQNNSELSRAYSQGYNDGYKTAASPTPNLTAQQAYDRGYQNGQTDARNSRTYDAVAGTYDLGIQNNPDLSRSYSRGYGDGFKSIAGVPASPSPAIGQRCTDQAQAQGLQVLSVSNIIQVGNGQEATLQVRRNGGAAYTLICNRDNSGQISFYPGQPMPPVGQASPPAESAERPPVALW